MQLQTHQAADRRTRVQWLEVDLLDLVTFPGDSPRQHLVDLTRTMKAGAIRRLVREAGE